MKNEMKKNVTISLLVIGLLMICSISVYADDNYTNTGQGKPKALDIYIGDFPYSASVGTDLVSGSKEEVPNEFKVIVDDSSIPDPAYFETLLPDSEEPEPEEPEPEITVTPIPTTFPPAIEPEDIVDVTDDLGKQLCVLDNSSDVIVEFYFSAGAYKNQFRLASPVGASLGWTQGDPKTLGDPFGKYWNLGKFEVGEELIFANTANGVTYYTGSKSRNPDKKEHAAISIFNSTGTYHKYLVSFEDLLKTNWNKGEPDYNDVQFFVSGNISTDCSTFWNSESEQDSLIPSSLAVCKCTNENSEEEFTGKDVCVAQFSYISSVDKWRIPVRDSSLPWNEFTGSGMVEQFRCQPTTFYITPPTDPNNPNHAPFWTNRFWNNIKWKLGYEKSVLVKCQQDTPTCESLGYISSTICKDCQNS